MFAYYHSDSEIETNTSFDTPTIKITRSPSQENSPQATPMISTLPCRSRQNKRSTDFNLNQLMSLGYPKNECENALNRAKNNLDRAIEYLTENKSVKKNTEAASERLPSMLTSSVQELKKFTTIEDTIIFQVLHFSNFNIEKAKSTLITMK